MQRYKGELNCDIKSLGSHFLVICMLFLQVYVFKVYIFVFCSCLEGREK